MSRLYGLLVTCMLAEIIQVGFLCLLAMTAVGGCLLGCGKLRWYKKGAIVAGRLDGFMKRLCLLGGVSATILFFVYLLEYLGIW